MAWAGQVYETRGICSTVFIRYDSMKEIGKLECPKKVCLLQMGMDVKDSEIEKKIKGGVPRRKRQNN